MKLQSAICKTMLPLPQGMSINEAACKLAREVAAEGNALVCGGVCQTPSYRDGIDPKHVQDIFRKQIQVLVNNKVDFILCEVSMVFVSKALIVD